VVIKAEMREDSLGLVRKAFLGNPSLTMEISAISRCSNPVVLL
jgi:hypothetical protein